MIYAVEALNFIQFLDKKGALYNKTFAKTVRHRATASAAPRARAAAPCLTRRAPRRTRARRSPRATAAARWRRGPSPSSDVPVE